MHSDLSYLRRRASEERTAALRARDPQVRQVHTELAERYEERVRALAIVGHHVPQPARTRNAAQLA